MTEGTDLFELLRKIGLRVARDAFEAFLTHVIKSKASPAQILEQLCALEQRERDARNLACRQKMATLGSPKTLDRFDWNHPRSIDRDLYEQLHGSLDFIRRGENILLRGQSGVVEDRTRLPGAQGGELGFDHYEGRSFLGWHHHVSVVLSCYAFVVAERVRAFPPSAPGTRRHHSIAAAA